MSSKTNLENPTPERGERKRVEYEREKNIEKESGRRWKLPLFCYYTPLAGQSEGEKDGWTIDQAAGEHRPVYGISGRSFQRQLLRSSNVPVPRNIKRTSEGYKGIPLARCVCGFVPQMRILPSPSGMFREQEEQNMNMDSFKNKKRTQEEQKTNRNRTK